MTVGTTLRRGPDLPYSLVAGVTPCGWRGSWPPPSCRAPSSPLRTRNSDRALHAMWSIMRPTLSRSSPSTPPSANSTRRPPGAGRVTGRPAPCSVRAWIGRQERPCPRRPPTITSSCPDHLDAISMTLLPRYREVASEMAPFRQRTIYEVHSDVSFYQLNGESRCSCRSTPRRDSRSERDSWRHKLPGALRIIDRRGSAAATPSHLLDAAAFLWTARRIFAKAGGPHPDRSRVGRARACGWRSSANARSSTSRADRRQNEWFVNGRRSSGPAKTATAHPSGEEDAVGNPALAVHPLGRDQRDAHDGSDEVRGEEAQQDVADTQPVQVTGRVPAKGARLRNPGAEDWRGSSRRRRRTTQRHRPHRSRDRATCPSPPPPGGGVPPPRRSEGRPPASAGSAARRR